jgi:hypothetical protein
MYMSFCNRVVLPIFAAVSLAFLVACSSSNNSATPPPTGGFTYSNLNGTYVFSTLGTDPSSGETMTIAGAFTACGCSQTTISGGTFDYLDPSVALQTGNAISSGSYSITPDGRGQITLANTSTLGTIHLDFVLNSTSGGLVSEYDTFGSGSGTLELQTAVTQTDVAGNYAYSVSGENVAAADPLAYAQAGAFTLSSTGAFAANSGVYDLTEWDLENGTSAANVANTSLTGASTLTVGTGTTPGQASFTDPSGNTYTFDVFAISSSDLKLFETDATFSAVGDAFPQATSLPSGTLAFTMNGVDSSVAPLSMGGLLTFSGTSITGGIEDYNDGALDAASGTGLTTNSAVLGSFNNPLVGGRATLQLTGFFNGAASGLNGTDSFAAYPTTNGTLLLEIDGAGITAGNALPQSNTSFASAQGYAVDVSGLNVATSSIYEEDDIAEFTSTSTGFSGLVDVNDEGQTFFDKTFDGTYSSVTTGRYQFTANSSSGFNGVSGAVYTVDGSTLLFVEGDNFQVGTGTLQVQNASGSDAQAAHHVAVFRGLLAAKNAAKRKQK